MSPNRILDTRLPLAAAPMAGGPSTPALARAIAAAGAFPFLAGGYLSAEALDAQIEEVRATGAPFGVNLFVPAADAPDPVEFAVYADTLREEALEYGLELDHQPRLDDDGWATKLDLLQARPVPVVSLTFGLPVARDIARLRAAGTAVLATVTQAAEARAAVESGVDGLVVQGPDAGGHSAIHDPRRTPAPASTVDLVRRVAASVDLPIIAAGGVDGPAGVRALLDAGAQAVAVGTLLLRADEAGTSATYRAALTDPAFDQTVLTRAFTGRPARALRNAFVQAHDRHAPTAYPAIHHLTRPLRQAAARTGDAQRLHLWAGTGYRNARPGPAADIIAALSEQI